MKLAILLAGMGIVLMGAAFAHGQGDTYDVGIAKVDITPDYPIRLNGFLSRKGESEGIRQKIWAKAMAIGNDRESPALLITVDNLGIPDEMTQEIAKRLQEKHRVSIDRLAIAASHTHTAPMIRGVTPNIFGMAIPPADQEHIDRYTITLTDRLVEVALQAIANRQPSTLSHGIGTVAFAKNRRSVKGPIDHDMPLLVVRDMDGKIRAIHASYACHCVTLSENRIGGDWAGYAQEHLERIYPGAVAMISVGCGADQNPIPGVMQDRFDIASQQGLEIASEVQRLIQNPLRKISGTLQCKYHRVPLDLAELPSRTEFEEKAKLDTPVGYHAKVQLEKMNRGEQLRSKIDYPIQTWSFGESLTMVFLAGEVVVDYSKRLKKELDPHRIWITAYSNAAPCYIPSERVLTEGGYEGANAMIYYDQPTRFAPGLEAKIIDEVKGQVGKAFLPPFDPNKLQNALPKSPAQSMKMMQTIPGMQVELVASEPLIASPVAVSFGPDRSVWVAEMMDYPAGLDGNFQPGGRVRVLRSSTENGPFDRSTIFLDKIPFPTGVTVWRNGLLICAAPDILYAEDRDGDDRADHVEKLFSGFGTDNYQARVNSLEYGLDGWLYGSCGLFGGDITIQQAAGSTPTKFPLGNRDFRIQPDLRVMETASGRTQQGRVRDDWGNWFGCSNSSFCFHFPLSEHYLKRNPFASAPPQQVTVPGDAEANTVYPANDQMQLFSLSGTGGRATAACGIGVYRDSILGSEYNGDTFTCESVNLVVHRLKLQSLQSTFRGFRPSNEEKTEFVRSMDTWFRPVQVKTAPDGSIWVVDMYRFVIEHPRWIPESDLAKVDVRAGHSMGRIYRIRPKQQPIALWPRLDQLDMEGLVAALDSNNGWQRDMATQLLLWRHGKDAIPLLADRLRFASRPVTRLHTLCLLGILDGLTPRDLLRSLKDPHAGVRRHAVRISEPFATYRQAMQPQIFQAVSALANDDDPQVRLQVACSLGEWKDFEVAAPLVGLASRPDADTFLLHAVLSSLHSQNIEGIQQEILRVSTQWKGRTLEQFLPSLIGLGTLQTRSQLVDALVGPPSQGYQKSDWSILTTLLESFEKTRKNGKDLLNEGAWSKIDLALEEARQICYRDGVQDNVRLQAIQVLGRRNQDRGKDREILGGLLLPKYSNSVQMTAASAISRNPQPDTLALLLSGWRAYSPSMKSHLLDIALSRDAWVPELLQSVEAGVIDLSEFSVLRRDQLLGHRNADVKQMAEKLLAGKVNPDRQKVIDDYDDALKLSANGDRGKEIFKKNCGVCHRIGEEGHSVGPDLTAVASKSSEFILQEILDPNRNLDGRYVSYLAATDDGRTYSGILVAETPTAVTLRNAEAKEVALLRSEIETLASSRASLMPEGFEKTLNKQDIADLLRYLESWQGTAKFFPGNDPETIRPLPQGIILSAQKGKIHGEKITFEEKYNNLSHWSEKNDYVAWTLEMESEGKFDVWIDAACSDESAGNSYVIECGKERVTGIVASTITDINYQQVKVGTMSLPEGVQQCRMYPAQDVRGSLVELRGIYLIPSGQPLRKIAMEKASERLALPRVAQKLLDETLSKEQRLAIVRANTDRAAGLIHELVRDMPSSEEEEYRRIPWIWNLAIDASKKNDPTTILELLSVSLPQGDETLRDWQAVVLGGGIINGLSLSGIWPKNRMDEILRGEQDLGKRWRTSIEQARLMADNEKVRKGTRYDALRMIALEPKQDYLPDLVKYLGKDVDPTLQQGAVSGLSDIDSPQVAELLIRHFGGFRGKNRSFALEALVRNESRKKRLETALQNGHIDPQSLNAEESKWIQAR